MNRRHQGLGSQPHQRLHQDRTIAQFKVLFADASRKPATTPGGRDQHVYIHPFVLSRLP
ncbi:MAG: hypothetical protein P8Y96_08315 [Desulfuromonadales bacterium]